MTCWRGSLSACRRESWRRPGSSTPCAASWPLDWGLVRDFGRRVLGQTARIPFGEVATYGEVAAAIGSPGGARATGNALGRNPMPIVVPCHRVVRGGGKMGGYTGGVERKELLLTLEREGRADGERLW
jgi:methylated-DNA-[protein]-cysteine S-methyltransferase